MSLLGEGSSTSRKKISAAKATLNPNAAEFVPCAFRSPAAGSSIIDESSKFATSSATSPGKAIFDRSGSSITNSDEEAQQYWSHQLPDDITPDFKIMSTDDAHGIDVLPFSSLSLTDVNEGLRYSTLPPHPPNSNIYAQNLSHSVSSYEEYPSPTRFQSSLAKPWDKQISSNDLFHAQGHPYNGNSRPDFLTEMPNEQLLMDGTDVNPIELLASQFPGFAAESLAEVYFTNGGDLNLTIEMLTQLELQVEGGLNETLNSKSLSTPNLSALDFPALSVTEGRNGLAASDLDQKANPYRSPEKGSAYLFRSSSSIPSTGATDFASAVRKMASQDSSIWKYERNGSSGTNIGPSRSSKALASPYNSGAHGRGIYSDRFQSRGSANLSPTWLETGEAVANMYSEMREEARDHARVRNAYFEQARQAYLVGNKALAKELSIKGQLHNMQMKAAHGKAQESIFRQRNQDMQVNGRERMIDLHGLHVSEAIHVLKRELALLRNAARSSDQRLLAYICVGTGHHTRGSRTPARLPTAVQRYLLEEEGLDYSEPQAGLLRVVIY